MKISSTQRFITAFSAAVIILGASLPAVALARTRSTHATGSKGGTYQREVKKSPGSYASSSTATLPNGKTATGSLTSEKTDTGRTTSAQRTDFNGKTSSYDSTRTKTDTGYVRQAEADGKNGGTASKNVVVSKQGNTVTRTATTQVTPPPAP